MGAALAGELIPTLLLLRQHGYTEAEVRRHSLEWIEATLERIGAQRRMRMAADIQSTYVAASAAFNGSEAFEQMEEVIAQLDPSTESDDEYLLDANAQPDTAALDRIKKRFDAGDAHG